MALKLLLEEVFKTEGLPAFTFVPPPNYNEILLDIRNPYKPVILEGQSGTGKTTCVRHILAELNPDNKPEYLTARNSVHVSRIEQIARDQAPGQFVIDDFHRLDPDLQSGLADVAKLSADLGADAKLPKLIIIGINQIGSNLIQLVPDIAKRTGVHRIEPGSNADINQLISIGSQALNVAIKGFEEIYAETRGDYWLTQQICSSICTAANVLQTQDDHRVISFTIDNVRHRVVEQLRASYYSSVKEFCRGQRFRPKNDPYFKLLRAVGQQQSSIVDLTEMANALPEVRGSINNIKERRLQVLIEGKPSVARYFYCNSESKTFAIEDPALFYFVKHLDWDQLRQDCGFRENSGEEFEFEIAISFAGENRALAAFVYESLTTVDVPVFYDEQYEANYLGKTWSKQFAEIFSTKSRYVLCILDKHYAAKIWPTFEKEQFTPRVATESVFPVFLDKTTFVGIPHDLIGMNFKFDHEDTANVDWPKRATDEIVLKLIDKLSE
jgi:hypothetical protein